MPAPPDRRLVFLLSVAHRRIQRWIDMRAGASGVTAAQSGVLFALARADGALIGDVALALDLAPSAMTGLADRMVANGLIERRADASDGRISRLHLTPHGRAALGRVRAALAELNATLTAGLSEAETEIVARWLSALPERLPRE